MQNQQSLEQRLAPIVDRLARQRHGPDPTYLRLLGDTEAVNDAEDAPEDPPIELDEEPSEFHHFDSGTTINLAAIDAGIARLGESEAGGIIALRGCVASIVESHTNLSLARTGPLLLRHDDRLPQLLSLGEAVGQPGFYVDLDGAGNPTKVKHGVADDFHQYADRFRNWIERMLQIDAAERFRDAALLLDGALTLRTRDTPSLFLERLGRIAGQNHTSIIAVSKQTRLVVRARPLRFLLDDVRGEVGYRCLTEAIRLEAINAGRTGEQRVLGNIYVARFSPLGPTFRVDVKPIPGQTDREALADFYSSALMRAGYPDLLVRAHAHSYFTSPDVLQLQVQAAATFGLRIRKEPDLGPIFSPFGGRFK